MAEKEDCVHAIGAEIEESYGDHYIVFVYEPSRYAPLMFDYCPRCGAKIEKES